VKGGRRTSSVLALGALLLLACGGSTLTTSGSGSDGGKTGDGPATRDTSSPEDTAVGDSAPGDSPSILDTGPVSDSTSVSCTPLPGPEGGHGGGCAGASCPAGTICVQRDMDVSATATCVGIPPVCKDHATCACMGKAAHACVEPDEPFGDAAPDFLRCQDETSDGTPYLDFPCGCA